MTDGTLDPDPPSVCFWTDLINATQVCSAPAPPAQDRVDVVMSTYDLFYPVPIDEWEWDGAPLYAPPPVSPPPPLIWVNAVNSGTLLGDWIYNTVYQGNTRLTTEDFYLDPVLGTIGTVGVISIPVLNTTGGSGPYSATGAVIYDGYFPSAPLYEPLPGAYKYPAWAERSIMLPPRRGVPQRRVYVEIPHFSGPTGLSSNFGFSSFGGSSNPFWDSAASPSGFSGTTTAEEYSQWGARPLFGPWESQEGIGVNAPRVVEFNWRPTDNTPLSIEFHVRPEVGIAAPGIIDAYVDGLEFFPREVAEATPTKFDVPPAGTGRAYPEMVIPVTYDDGNDTWWLGVFVTSDNEHGTTNPEYANEVAPAPYWEAGILVGTMRKVVDDSVICRISMRIDMPEEDSGGH